MLRVFTGKRLGLTFGAAILLAALATPGIALAATTSTSVGPPVSSGAYGTVLHTQVVPVAGGVVSATDKYGTTYALTVPAGAFTNPVQIALLAPSVTTPANATIDGEVAVAVVQNGNPVTATFAKPLTLAVTVPNITTSPTVQSVSLSGHASTVGGVIVASAPLVANAAVVTISIPAGQSSLQTYTVLSVNPPPPPLTLGDHLLRIALPVFIISIILFLVAWGLSVAYEAINDDGGVGPALWFTVLVFVFIGVSAFGIHLGIHFWS